MRTIIKLGRAAAVAALVLAASSAMALDEVGDFPDNPALAPVIPLFNSSRVVVGTIDGTRPNDLDFLTLSLTVGDRLLLDLDRYSNTFASATDTVVSLFNPGGTLVAFNDDTQGLGSSSKLGSVIAPFVVQQTGTYTLAISAAGNEPLGLSLATDTAGLHWSGELIHQTTPTMLFSGGATAAAAGPYAMLVSRLAPNAPIAENVAAAGGDFGNSRAGAFDPGALPSGSYTTITGTMQSANDLDVIRIVLAAGQTLYADTDEVSGDSDLRLALFNSQGALVAHNDDNEAAGSAGGVGSLIAPFVAPASGEYFLFISDFQNAPAALAAATLEDLLISGQRILGAAANDAHDLSGLGIVQGYTLTLYVETPTVVPEPAGLAALVCATILWTRRGSRPR